MQDFGRPPYGPLDDSLDDPLDPFNDPFEAMLNDAFGSEPNMDNLLDAMYLPVPRIGEGEGRDNFGNLLGNAEPNIEGTPPIRLGPDSLDETLGQLEKGIENTPPIRLEPDSLDEALGQLEKSIESSPPRPPVPATDDLDSALTALEEHIENTLISPEPQIEVELFEDSGWVTPSTDSPSPPLGIYGKPAIQSTRDGRSVRRSRGTSKNKQNSGNKVWCPVQEDYVPPETCEDKDCEHYNPNTHECMYNTEDSDL